MVRRIVCGRYLGANIRSRTSALAVLVFTATVPARAAGPPVPVRVELDAPPDCPNGDQFLAEILKRAPGARAATPAEAARRFRGSIRRGSEGFVGSVESESLARTDARTAQAATCPEVVSSLAMTVALSLDADTATTAAPAPALPVPNDHPPALAAPSSKARQPAASDGETARSHPAATYQWGLSVEGLVLMNALPLSAGGAGRLMLRRAAPGAWSPAVRIGAGFLRPVRDVSEVEVRMPFLTAALCTSRWDVGAVELAPCLRSFVGSLGGQASPPLQGNAARLPFGATGPELQLGFAAKPLWLGVTAGVLWVWSAPVFRTQPSGRALLRTEAWAASATLGAGVVF